MATLTQPDDTGTLERGQVLDATSDVPDRPTAGRPVTLDALDRRAAELRAWLDEHGTTADTELARRGGGAQDATERLDASDRRDVGSGEAPQGRSSAAHGDGVPGILVGQRVWQPTPVRYEAPAADGLERLVDRAFAPVPDQPGRAWLGSFVAGGDEQRRNRVLGWGLAVGVWAVAAALLIPLLIVSLVGSFDLTVDLGGDVDREPTTQAPATQAPAQATTAGGRGPDPGVA